MPGNIYIDHLVQKSTEDRKGHQTPAIGTTFDYKPSCGCWGLSPDLLQEWQVLLSAESSLFSLLLVTDESQISEVLSLLSSRNE